jgi:hypothetical protein
MRNIFLISLFIFTTSFIFAQTEVTRYYDKDQLGIELLSIQWLTPPEGVEIEPYSNAFNLQYMVTLVGKNSNVAIAMGVGLLTENYHLNALPVKQANELELVPIDNEIDYQRNKIRLLTLELPLELRIRSNKNSRNKHWKLYLGGKAGYKVQSMHKYIGENPVYTGDNLKQKTYNLRYTEPLSYGVTARLGYGQFFISGYYSFTNHFQNNKGPELVPFMVGITLFLY